MPIEQRLEEILRAEVERVNVRRHPSPRTILFVSLIAASALAALDPLRRLLLVSMGSDEYSYLVLIPIMVVGLFYLERKKIFQELHYSWGAGLALILVGAGIIGGSIVLSTRLSSATLLFLEVLGLVIVWMDSFILCYGTHTARAGLFALLFILLFVPLPEALLARPIALIQHGSANVTSFLFGLFGVPVFRQGLTFSLPRLTFVVATECSGIHSSTGLFITTLLVGHFYFKPSWAKGLLVLLVFPIISFTNGLRMFVLATLAVYVDMNFFYGNLHKKGGILFFVLALLILALITKLLRGRPLQAGNEKQKRATSAE
ncbi:MAG: exosortase/archaeosortase family protein [Terriglobia bacterium]